MHRLRCVLASLPDERTVVSLRESTVSDPVVVEVFDLPAQTACFSGG